MKSGKVLLASAVVAWMTSVSTNATQVTTLSATDPFYTYSGDTPLSSLAPGTVLKTRTLNYHVAGIATPVVAQQLLYRTNNARHQAIANVTSVILSPAGNGRAISYQSAYDSLNPADGPSRVIAGDRTLGGLIYSGESIPLSALLLLGYDVIVPDTEGPNADFAAGPEYAMTTLDSIRATLSTPSTGLPSSAKVALMGYSGGGIATTWAAQLAPTYAPDVNRQLVGAAAGGLLVAPAHNVNYVDGSLVWGGIAPTALVGISRAYGVDFSPYLTPAGIDLLEKIKDQSILQILPTHIGLRLNQVFKPEYVSNLNKIPEFVTYTNLLNAGQYPSPTIPMYITQGGNGALDGTYSWTVGDGVMITGDVRTLARQFCADGVPVQYNEALALDHFGTAALWAVASLPWLYDRFDDRPAPNNCSKIRPGNSLDPEVLE